jgi:hypothetical protein
MFVLVILRVGGRKGKLLAMPIFTVLHDDFKGIEPLTRRLSDTTSTCRLKSNEHQPSQN